jgi:Family of unknown function (DUF5681)
MSDHTVGYRRPPIKNRFKKGTSGNPAGRPKGSRNLSSELKLELARSVTVRENGESKRVSKRAAILKSLVAKALGGDVKAIRAVVELIAQFEHFEAPVGTANVASDEQRILRRYLPRARKAALKKRGKHK